MREQQLDLFSASGIPPECRARPDSSSQELIAADLDDAALVAAIPWAGLAEAPALAAEAGRRRLLAAMPALEQLCRRFAGFGLARVVPEQAAALEALVDIGGPESARTVARLITRDIVQGPTLRLAVNAAARLRATLPVATVVAFLRDGDPMVRANACRCAGPWPAVLPVLREAADDDDDDVRLAAACALGRLGQREARPELARRLRDAPSAEVVEAVAAVADEDCIILLGRIARDTPTLAEAARDALELIDHPRARQIVTVVTGQDE